jgi:hypothetical protein
MRNIHIFGDVCCNESSFIIVTKFNARDSMMQAPLPFTIDVYDFSSKQKKI